jgi:ATP-dependent RNA helicase SUPV3L1/SUV3
MGYRQEPFPDPSTSADPDQPNPINPHLTPKAFQPTPPPPSRRLVDILLSRLPEWTQSQRALRKLEAYGLTDAHRHLRRWADTVNDGLGGCESDEEASAALVGGGWDEVNLTQSFDRDGAGFAGTLEAAFMRRFLTYCTTSERVSRPLKTHLKSLLDVTDLSRIAFTGDNTRARAMRRNFHLHIGPTNSGKTYSALKSLARATSGAYAGPLRLLAHEVWERLNLGTVGGLDGESKKCNLLTGEERRIVDPDAALLSCTIEMLPFGGPLGGQGYEVVVIDEIQMMGDPHRGGSWTKAVLGVRAKEVHLCGDQTTVDLLSTLITSLGDTLTIHRYDRLTPLTVAEESLEGDFNKVEAGDCIVTFSRSNIFSVKKMIEEKTGRKCAVVYGALPPETRAEQARDFNDENGIAEVLVASDAVGMGLNLWVGPFCDNPDG